MRPLEGTTIRGWRRACARRQTGFTLIEMMVVISILAIVAAVAVPGFQQIMMTSKLKSYTTEVLTSLMLARSEAIKRNAPVRACVSTNGTSCAGSGDWEAGWIVIALDGTVIKRNQAVDSAYKITSSGGHTLTFQASGAASTASNFKVCRQSPSAGNQERTLSLSLTGKPNPPVITTTGTCP